MKYNNRYFPHPVLGIRDDINGEFSCDFTVEVSDSNTIFIPKVKLINKDLEKLIDSDQAEYCMQIYCRATMYRELFTIYDPIGSQFQIPSSKLNGETEVDFFLCASKYIETYKNEEFNEDYSDYGFELEKGDIIAYGGKGLFFANKAPEELKSVSAIMNIKNSGKTNGPFYNDYDGPKITLFLSDSDFNLYQSLIDYECFIPVIHSSIVFPALYETVCFMEYDDSASQFEDHQWYKIIRKRIDEDPGTTLLEKVQNILDLPVNRSLKSIERIFDNENY